MFPGDVTVFVVVIAPVIVPDAVRLFTLMMMMLCTLASFARARPVLLQRAINVFNKFVICALKKEPFDVRTREPNTYEWKRLDLKQ